MSYLIGDTITLNVAFRDSGGSLIDVDEAMFVIYDQDRKKLMEEPLTEEFKMGIGQYSYNYTVPEGDSPLIIEFKGMKNGFPTVERQQIDRNFIKQMY